MGDLKGECRAHGHLGAVHMSLGNYTNAIKCYQEQLERAKELRESAVEAQAFGNLGIARLNMGHYEDAIGYLEQQLATLEQLSTPTALMDKVPHSPEEAFSISRHFGCVNKQLSALVQFS